MNQQAHTAIAVLDEIMIEANNISIEQWCSEIDYDYRQLLQKAKSRIQALWDGWIPVTEDMERNKLYLLYAIEWFYFIWYYDWASNNYCRDWSDWELVIATHYKPLPLPPITK